MEDRCYAPYPISMFRQLDRIRELTKVYDYVTYLEPVTEPDIEGVRGILCADKSEEEDKVEFGEPQSPPAKRHKRLSQNSISLENLTSAKENLDLNELENLLDKSFAPEESSEMLRICEKTLVPSLVQIKTKSASLNGSLMYFIEKYPTSAIILATGLAKEIEFEAFVQNVIEKDFLTENQERTLMEKWISNCTISGECPIFEAVVSRQPNIFGESHFMEMVSRNMLNNLSTQKHKCPKFSKFLLRIITKIPAEFSQQPVYNNLKILVESNKTFLKKRMEQELKRKSS